MGLSAPKFVFIDQLLQETNPGLNYWNCIKMLLSIPNLTQIWKSENGYFTKMADFFISTSPLLKILSSMNSIQHQQVAMGVHPKHWTKFEPTLIGLVYGLMLNPLSNPAKFAKSSICLSHQMVYCNRFSFLFRLGTHFFMDLIPLWPSYKGYTTILVLVDRFSKAAHFGMLPSNTQLTQLLSYFRP